MTRVADGRLRLTRRPVPPYALAAIDPQEPITPMDTDRILVGRSYKRFGLWASLIVALILLPVGGTLIPTSDMILGIVFATAGGLLLLTAIVIFLWIKSGRMWLTLHENGFTIEDRTGMHSFREEDVLGVGYAQEVVLTNGAPSHRRHCLNLWLMGTVDPYRLTHTTALEQSSPVGLLSRRCHEHLTARTRPILDQSGSLEGDGWRMDRQHFHITNPMRPESYRWDEFSAIEVFDEHIGLWLKGEPEPKFRFPVASKNALLLGLLGQERLPKAPEGAAPDVEGLGRILFQRQSPWGVLALLGATGAIIGLGMLGFGEWIWGVIVASGGVGVLLWAFSARHTHFRCHERGVCLAKWIENREIRFDEVEVFTYGSTRHYYNGAYTGTVYIFEFHPRADTGKKKIRYTATIQGQDCQMDDLRDHIAKVIAMRMARDMDSGQAVQWTPNLRFLPDGLEFRPAGFIGRKAPETIPYSAIQSAHLDEGRFHIWVKGTKKSVVQVPISEPNFFPGYSLFLSRFALGASDKTAAPEPPTAEADTAAAQ